MSDAPEFEKFDDFFMFYLSQHSKTTSRRIEAAGTLVGLAVATKALIKGPRWKILALPAFIAGSSAVAHFVIEKNKPPFLAHPLWSKLAGAKMLAGTVLRKDDMMQLGADLYLLEHEDARSAGSSVPPGWVPDEEPAAAEEAIIEAVEEAAAEEAIVEAVAEAREPSAAEQVVAEAEAIADEAAVPPKS